jgi:hypothetical protein
MLYYLFIIFALNVILMQQVIEEPDIRKPAEGDNKLRNVSDNQLQDEDTQDVIVTLSLTT